MQRVLVEIKLGYEGPRRRLFRNICGQVQEWQKFFILIFSFFEGPRRRLLKRRIHIFS